MEAAAFCFSHPSSSISLIPPKSSLHFTSKNRTLISYSYSSLTTTTTTTKQQHYLSCTTNSYKQHDLSCFRSNSFTGLSPRRYVFRPTICAVDGRVNPRKDKDNDDDGDKQPGIIAGLSTTVVLACTVVGTIMCLNGRLMQAKALINIPAGLHDDQNINKLMTTSMNKKDNYNPFFRGRDQSSDFPAASDSSRTSTFRISELKEYSLSMAPDEAIKKLKLMYEATKQDMDRAYLIEMLIVEILIRQGKYKEALSRSCLSEIKTPNDVVMSDIRIYVYKTFIYVMTDDNVQAKIWCKGLLENFEKMGPPRKQPMSFDD